MSELHLILGPMFAGKTTSLINKANEISDILNKDKILLINHSSDIRYSENTFITSHDNLKIPCIAMSTLCTIFENISFDKIIGASTNIFCKLLNCIMPSILGIFLISVHEKHTDNNPDVITEVNALPNAIGVKFEETY